MGYQFVFELDVSRSDTQVWKSLSPTNNTNSNCIEIRTDDSRIELWFNRVKLKGNENSSYELMLQTHSRDLDVAGRVKLLESRVPQIFSASSKDAKIEIRLNDNSKIALEKWS